MADLLENYRRVLDGIREAATAAGRASSEVKLLAVSKTFPSEDIRTVFEAGQIRFGENKVQELQTKVPLLPADIEWHLIGHLQTNKVKYIIDTCYEKAVKLINENRDKLDACAALLLEKEKINRAEFEALFGEPDPDSEASEGVDIAD